MQERKKPSSGKEAEEIAAKYLESLGFNVVSLAASEGPDIVCRSGTRDIFVEVKQATCVGYTWCTTPVYPARRADDLVAIVFPNSAVHLCPMAEHLAKANNSTVRAITNLMREHCPEMFPTRGRPRGNRKGSTEADAFAHLVAIGSILPAKENDGAA